MANEAIAPVRNEHPVSDEDLMRAYQNGDNLAFEALFQRHHLVVAHLIRRGVRREEQVSELVQLVFLKLHRSRERYSPERKFKSWLYTIALNVRRDQVRRTVRCIEVQVTVDNMGKERPSTVERLNNKQLVEMALEVLPERTQAILRLYWFENKSFGEIAAMLGIGRSAAKVAAHRSYRQMRVLLEEQALAA